MSLFEAGMVLCFGISWPVAIIKTLKTRAVHGKSTLFLVLVLSGYALGILHKAIYNLDYVIILYLFNFSMVLTELCLCLRYRKDLFPDNAASFTPERYKLANNKLAT